MNFIKCALLEPLEAIQNQCKIYNLGCLNILTVTMYYINVAHINVDSTFALEEDILTSIPQAHYKLA